MCTPRWPPRCAASRSRTWAVPAGCGRGPGGGRLPWPLLRRIYTRVGAAEGIDPDRLGDVDLAAVAHWLAEATRGGAIRLRSSARATVPWPTSPPRIRCPGCPAPCWSRSTASATRSVRSTRCASASGAPRPAGANPDVVLHHMHDQVQDELMVARMTYFRTKWRTLPAAYARFLAALAPGAPVMLVEDTSAGRWSGSGNGTCSSPAPRAAWTRRTTCAARTPRPPTTGARGRVGRRPGLAAASPTGAPRTATRWSGSRYPGRRQPPTPSRRDARLVRRPRRSRRPAARPPVRPRRPVADHQHRRVPYWTFFSVQPALRALEAHLAAPHRTGGPCCCSSTG